MMRPISFVFIVYAISFWIVAGCDTAHNVEDPQANYFVKYYGEDGNQTGVDMIVLNDGNFLLLGNSEFNINGTRRIYLVKVDAKGEVIWQKKLGGISDVAKDIEAANDGTFIILAENDKSADNTDAKLIRVTSDGNVIDSVVYGSPKNDYPQTVTPLLDGGFIITGSTQYDTTKNFNPIDPSAYSNIFHYRCDANLIFDTVNWYELYGAADRYDAGSKVIQSGNSFYVFGYSDAEHGSWPAGKLHLQYYAIESGGIPKSKIGYLGDFTQNTRASYVMQVPAEFGGGFFLIGTETKNTGAVSLHVSKLRAPLQFNAANDELLDQEISVTAKTLDGISAEVSLTAPQGYLLLANEARSLGSNIWLTKIDQSGAPKWSVSLGSESGEDKAAVVKELRDGKIMVLGTIELGDNQTKMALFKLNSDGRLQD
jgi:hypothetical protein